MRMEDMKRGTGDGEIRPATVSDTPVLRAIYAPYVEQTTISFEQTVPTEEEFRERMKGILGLYPYLVYEEEGRILGYAYAHRVFERYAYRFDAELSVYVERTVRHRGIGEKLYRRLIEECRRMGLQTLYAIVTSPNEPSERLHEKLGFAQVGHFPRSGYKMARWLDVRWYALAIGDFCCPPEEWTPFSCLRKEETEK